MLRAREGRRNPMWKEKSYLKIWNYKNKFVPLQQQ